MDPVLDELSGNVSNAAGGTVANQKELSGAAEGKTTIRQSEPKCKSQSVDCKNYGDFEERDLGC